MLQSRPDLLIGHQFDAAVLRTSRSPWQNGSIARQKFGHSKKKAHAAAPFEGATRVILYEKTSILHLRRTRVMVGPSLFPIFLSLNLRKVLPCSETKSDKRLRRLSASTLSASHT